MASILYLLALGFSWLRVKKTMMMMMMNKAYICTKKIIERTKSSCEYWETRLDSKLRIGRERRVRPWHGYIYYSSTCNNSINNTRLVNINVKNININIYVKKIGKHRAALLCSHCFMRHRTHHSLTAKVKIKCNESVKQRWRRNNKKETLHNITLNDFEWQTKSKWHRLCWRWGDVWWGCGVLVLENKSKRKWVIFFIVIYFSFWKKIKRDLLMEKRCTKNAIRDFRMNHFQTELWINHAHAIVLKPNILKMQSSQNEKTDLDEYPIHISII